jgi:hypothetical protein
MMSAFKLDADISESKDQYSREYSYFHLKSPIEHEGEANKFMPNQYSVAGGMTDQNDS